MIFDKIFNQNWLKNIFAQAPAQNFSNYSTSGGTSGSCYLALYTEMPDDDGLNLTEVSGNHYSRIYISGTSAGEGGHARVMNTNYKSFALKEQAAQQHYRRIGNEDEISFPEALNPADEDASTGGDWGRIVGFGLYSARTEGTPKAWGRVNNYELLTEEPDDWAENYTDYYTRTGTVGNYTYTHVTGDSAPTFAADTYYGRWITVNTHNKLIFREGHFEVYTTEDD